MAEPNDTALGGLCHTATCSSTPITLSKGGVGRKCNQALKVMMSQMSVVQPPDWTRNFHVFVDASDIAIDSVLMQLTEPKRLAVRSRHFCLIQDTLYHKGADGIWRRVVRSD